jgi:hypothetical protein
MVGSPPHGDDSLNERASLMVKELSGGSPLSQRGGASEEMCLAQDWQEDKGVLG